METIEETINTKRDMTWKEKLFAFTLFTLLVGVIMLINWQARGRFNLALGVYGSITITYLLGKMFLSLYYKSVDADAPNLKISVVVPSYNEKPEAVLGTIKSILAQDYPISQIFFVDDGSQDTSGYEAVLRFKDELSSAYNEDADASIPKTSQRVITDLVVHRLSQNRGKRHAQIWAFERASGDIIVTVDSDCTLLSGAIRELLKPLNNKKVMATTGHVNVRNVNDNLLTRLIDMRYDNAFRVERAAHSVTGNVLVCSGPLSAYRREVIMDNLDHYGSQTFLGEPVQFGDDRCLTNYAIRKGRTYYQSTARCLTDAPTTLGKFIKQQARWNKSFFRESLVALKIGLRKPLVFIWVVLELSLWILFGLSLFIAFLAGSKTMLWILLTYYIGYISISAYARNVFYALKRPLTFLLAPVYGILHLTLLFPLRFYSLLTIKSNGWGTR